MNDGNTREFVALDLETSGIDPRFAEIIEVGAVRFDSTGKVLDELDMLVKPTREVPEAILRLTGISRGELELAAPWEEVKPKVEAFVGDAPLVGQSINFDIDFLRFGGVKTSKEWYDTWHLSTALFPGLEAYSLEALSEVFGIELEDAHRAVSDCHASRELFLYDCWALAQLDEDVKQKLTELSGKSRYAIGDLLAALPAGNQPPELATREHPGRGGSVDLRTELGETAPKLLLNLPPGTDLTESLAKSLDDKSPRNVIAVSSRDDQGYLLDALEQAGVHAAVLLDQASVVSQKRLDQLLDQKRFSLTEAVFSSKLIIWQAKTERGARSELSLGGEENGLWRQISCQGLTAEELSDERFWQKHREEVQGARQLLTSFRGLAEEHLPDGVRLIVSDFQLFDELMTSHLSTHLHSDSRAGEEERSQGSLDIVWGLLGMAVRNLAAEGSSSLLVTARVRASHEWAQLTEALKNTAERAKGDKRNDFLVSQLKELLESEEGWVVWVESDGERVSVHRSPLDLNPLLEQLSADRPCLLLSAGKTLAPEGFEVSDQTPQDEQQITTMLLEDAPNPSHASAADFLRRLLLHLAQEDHRIYVAFSSKNAAAEFAAICGAEIGGRMLIGEGINGNLNRTRLLWRRDPKQIVLGSMRSNRQGFLSCEFDTIVVPKLAFDPPGIPLHDARGQTRGGFGGYTVPRVAQKVRQLLSKLDPAGRKEVILADGRLYSSNYGKDIIKLLELDIEASTLDQLQ